jgi:hypothetical protein
MHLQVYGGEEKGRNTSVLARLALPGWARWGGVWHGMVRQGDGHGRTMCV